MRYNNVICFLGKQIRLRLRWSVFVLLTEIKKKKKENETKIDLQWSP